MTKPKTTEEIFHHFPTICYVGIEHGGYKDKKKCDLLKNQKWIPLSEHKEILEEGAKLIEESYDCCIENLKKKHKAEIKSLEKDRIHKGEKCFELQDKIQKAKQDFSDKLLLWIDKHKWSDHHKYYVDIDELKEQLKEEARDKK